MASLSRKIITLFCVVAFILQSCSGTKVLSAWKAEENIVNKFKGNKVLVIARTSNNQARIEFESAITKELKSRGISATPSFSKAPKIYPKKEITEERVAFIKELLGYEGFDAIVLTVIKDKAQSIQTSSSGIFVGASYNNFYPGYYGTFYDYYAYPYAYGSYYNSFGGYIPTSSSTYVVTDYVLETVAYNLNEEKNDQLVAVVTTELNNPKNAHKAAGKYVEKVMKSLEKKK